MIRLNKKTFYDHTLRRFYLTEKPSAPEEKNVVCVSEPAAWVPGLTNATRLRAFSYMYKLIKGGLEQ